MGRMSAAIVLLALAMPPGAYAQTEAPPRDETATGDEKPLETIPVNVTEPKSEEPKRDKTEGTRLEDVVVTATKRVKSAREIPVTVHAYSGEDLMRRGA